jgi:hypothetical protein
MIKPKKKICSECQKESYIFSKGRCKPCAAKSYGKPKPVSKKRKSELQDYSKLRTEFMRHNPFCQAWLVGCERIATDVHHTAGRTNDKLNDTKDWIALCRNCHKTIHDSMSAAEARKLGLKK